MTKGNLENRSLRGCKVRRGVLIAIATGIILLSGADMDRSIGDYVKVYKPKIQAGYEKIVNYFQQNDNHEIDAQEQGERK